MKVIKIMSLEKGKKITLIITIEEINGQIIVRAVIETPPVQPAGAELPAIGV